MSERKNPGKTIHRVCAIVAVICVAAMFVPIGASRSAEMFGLRLNHFSEVTLIVSGLGEHGVSPIIYVFAFALMATAILLLVWAIRSFGNRADAGKTGVTAAIMDIVLTILMSMASFDMGEYYIPIHAIVLLLAILALVLAILQRKAAK